MATETIDGNSYDVDKTGSIHDRPPRLVTPENKLSPYLTGGDIPVGAAPRHIRTLVNSTSSSSPNTILDLDTGDAPYGGIVTGIEILGTSGSSPSTIYFSDITVDDENVQDSTTNMQRYVQYNSGTGSTLPVIPVMTQMKFLKNITLKMYVNSTNTQYYITVTWIPYPKPV